ncbi:hypothetical protein [Paenibacillus sp. FSL P2-0136]|uniref:hypothetical protein n=1 Tax=Paenibacillus sp. FSL P2-0136 TaxID=2975317 RepID=UPI0030D803CD
MGKFIKLIYQAVLYMLAAIAVHLILIYFLEIRIEGWATGIIILLCKTYFLPLCMCFINSLLFIRANKREEQITWFLFTVIPSSLLLFLFVELQGIEPRGYAVVSFELFRKYQFEMLYLFPLGILIIQFLMTLYYLISVRVWKRN